MDKPKSVKKFYSLAETIAMCEGDIGDLMHTLSYKKSEEKSISENSCFEDLYCPAVVSNENDSKSIRKK